MSSLTRRVWRAPLGPATLLIALLAGAAAAEPRLVPPQASIDLGTVRAGDSARHVATLRNDGTDVLRLLGVDVSRGLTVARGPAAVPPGGEIPLSVVLDTARITGDYLGLVRLRTNDPVHQEVTLRLVARVVTAVDVVPRSTITLVGTRGTPTEASVDLVNHDAAPLEIVGLEHGGSAFTTRLETIEQGRRHRLTVALNPDGAAGRHTDTVVVRTANTRQPSIRVAVTTLLREEVYTFPDEIDMGTLSRAELEASPHLASQLSQTLMVYQANGSDFRADFSTDLSFLQIDAERGPDGDRWQAALTLEPTRLSSGPIRGSIDITTNDPRFPRLRVPVTGEIR